MGKFIKQLFSVLPQNQLSKIAGKMTNSSWSKAVIKMYSKKFNIDVDEAEKTLDAYADLNEFFTRRLKEGARPIDTREHIVVSPVDGVISQFGKINKDKIIQAKGIDYSIKDLIGESKSESFVNGQFMVIYLSPSHYHRIHMPTKGAVESFEYIPGRLYPVNRLGVEHVNGLFTKNERLTTYYDVQGKKAALVKVGAFIVGSIKISYRENVHLLHRGEPYQEEITEKLLIEKGEEVGLFEFGSTVILLFEENTITFDEKIRFGDSVKMGESIATLNLKKLFGDYTK